MCGRESVVVVWSPLPSPIFNLPFSSSPSYSFVPAPRLPLVSCPFNVCDTPRAAVSCVGRAAGTGAPPWDRCGARLRRRVRGQLRAAHAGQRQRQRCDRPTRRVAIECEPTRPVSRLGRRLRLHIQHAGRRSEWRRCGRRRRRQRRLRKRWRWWRWGGRWGGPVRARTVDLVVCDRGRSAAAEAATGRGRATARYVGALGHQCALVQGGGRNLAHRRRPARAGAGSRPGPQCAAHRSMDESLGLGGG